MKKPNFFIVGAPKAGTTSLYRYLSKHPEIYLAKIKEPNFFSKDIDPKNFSEEYLASYFMDLNGWFEKGQKDIIPIAYIRKKDQYLKLFEKADEKVVGECSTSYLYSKVAPKEIKNFNLDSKIIIILRNPIERAFSHYLMDIRDGIVKNKNFEECINQELNKKHFVWGKDTMYIEIGRYYKQLKMYLNYFPKENIRIYLYDDFKKHQDKLIEDLFNFLGVKQIKVNTKVKYNTSKKPRFRVFYLFLGKNKKIILFYHRLPIRLRRIIEKLFFSKNTEKITQKEKEKLKKVYEKDIKNTSTLLNQDLVRLWLKD